MDDGCFGFQAWTLFSSLLSFQLVTATGLVIVTRLVLVSRLGDREQTCKLFAKGSELPTQKRSP